MPVETKSPHAAVVQPKEAAPMKEIRLKNGRTIMAPPEMNLTWEPLEMRYITPDQTQWEQLQRAAIPGGYVIERRRIIVHALRGRSDELLGIAFQPATASAK